MHRLTKLVDCHALFHAVAFCLKHCQISCKTARFAGNIDYAFHAVIQNLRQCFRVYAVSWRIQNDQIRFFCNIIECLQHIVRKKSAVCDAVHRCILFCRFHCLRYDLHANHLFCNSRCNLSDRSGSAVEIKDHFVFGISDVLSDRLIQNLSSSGVWLEEGKWCDLKTQFQQLLIKIVLTIQKSCLIAFYDI